MELNWTIEVITGFLVSSVLFSSVLLSYLKTKHIKIKSLFYFRASFFFAGLLFLIEAFSDLFLSILLVNVYYVFLPATLISFVIGINYSKKESLYSLSLILLCILTPIFYISAFIPNTFEIIVVPGLGYQKIITKGVYDLLSYVFFILTGVYGCYWGILTWRNTPFLYKKEAFLLILSMLVIIPIAYVMYLLTLLHPTFILLSDILFAIAWYIFILAITKEPKLLYILPFTIYRIVVKDRDGYPLFDHDWSDSEVNENVFAGFINAVQVMSEEVMHIGGILDINLQKGMLIINNSKYITVGLVASKSSQLLRDCVSNFTRDFERQFEPLLKISCRDMKKYEPAYIFIDKYFSNFPYRIIPNKHHPLLISTEFKQIPLQIDDKYYEIFKDDEDIEKIKAELLRFPKSSHDDFLNLYDELKDEEEVDFDKEEDEPSED